MHTPVIQVRLSPFPSCHRVRAMGEDPPPQAHILFFINGFQVGPEVALQRKVEAPGGFSRGISEEQKQEEGGSRPWKIHCQERDQHLVCIRLRASKPKA